MKRAVTNFVPFVAVCLVTVFLGEVGSAETTADRAASMYLVLLEEPPAAAHPDTKPAPGERFDRNDRDVQRYVAHLETSHGDVARRVGATRVYDYLYSLNAFAAALTPAQVARLQGTPGVARVERDSLKQVRTDNTPTFLGLNSTGGIWSELGGQGSAGEDVIIGVVDTGIWPEHPSFSGTGYSPAPEGWNGTCQSGEQWSQRHCNNKLIGARYFEKGYGHFGGQLSGDFQSVRDSDGHGSHTASIAGGNAGVEASVLGGSLGTTSGVAPRARIAAYKACWPRGCATTDLVAAIDAAVADGVDVINYSIGDGDPDFLDADDVAFLFARQAGVFVAASAGNSGPGPSTVDHGGPWLTTVGASTQNRVLAGTVTLGNGQAFKGVSITPGLGSTPIVDGAAAGSVGCLTGLDPAEVTGKIVLCEGSFRRAARSRAVKAAGGAGMVLYTAAEHDSLMSDNHHVPAVHVANSVGQAIRTYIAAAGTTASASLSGVSKEFRDGNTMAGFSSRGPLLPSERSTGDLLKPDVTAPGVQILGANSPVETNGAPGQLFQAIGGTSMSSPHVAGIGALLRDRHPTWTPDVMQSALMTSARQDVRKENGTTPADPFDFGAGHVVPNGAADPGLVYPVGFDDYRGFLRSQGLCRLCFGTAPAPEMAPTDLNVPSVTIGALSGMRTVQRTVRNVSAAGTYRVSVVAPPGVDVKVSPSSLSLATGQSATYTVSFSSNSAAVFNEYSFGSLTWSDGKKGNHVVRIPLVVRPVKLAAPATLSGVGTSGSATQTVSLGYSGPFSSAAEGLVPAATDARTVADDPSNNFNTSAPDANAGIQVHTVAVPAHTTLARFQLFDEFTDGEDDLDLFVYRVEPDGALTLVGESLSATSKERVDLPSPAAGTYRAYVHGWQTDGTSADYTLFSWSVPPTASGNLAVSSSTTSATAGATATITAAWSGLTSGLKYLGRIRYSDGAGAIGATIVDINA